MIQQIIKKSSKIDPESMEIEAWTGLEGSWGKLGSHLGFQGRLAQKQGARRPTNDHVWASILGSMFDISHCFSMFFCILFLVSILMATKTDVSWILISLFDHFLKFFS